MGNGSDVVFASVLIFCWDGVLDLIGKSYAYVSTRISPRKPGLRLEVVCLFVWLLMLFLGTFSRPCVIAPRSNAHVVAICVRQQHITGSPWWNPVTAPIYSHTHKYPTRGRLTHSRTSQHSTHCNQKRLAEHTHQLRLSGCCCCC